MYEWNENGPMNALGQKFQNVENEEKMK